MDWNLAKKVAIWHFVLTVVLVNLASYLTIQSYVNNAEMDVWGRLTLALEKVFEFPVTLFVYHTSAGAFVAVLFTGLLAYIVYALNSIFMGWLIVYLKGLIEKYKGLPNY